jgi:hypothetical protein
MRGTKSSVTVLPGGAHITLDGYLPPKTCSACKVSQPAAAFLKFWLLRDGRRILTFGTTCLVCDRPPRPFPADLRGARLSPSFIDDAGRQRGWKQRDKERGRFGDELSLNLLRLRQTADGVFRPQPKLDRRSENDIRQHPRQNGFSLR